MRQFCRVELLPGSGKIRLPDGLLTGTTAREDLHIRFGLRETSGTLSPTSTRLPCVGLSEDLWRVLLIPLDGLYQIKVVGRSIELGPVVGLLCARVNADLTPGRLKAMENHLLNFGHTRGLFVAFGLEGLRTESADLVGHRFLGHGPEPWEEGVFPVPKVVFRRFGIPMGPMAEAIRRLGASVFNERIFHKLEFWDWASRDETVRAFLPDSKRLLGPSSVLEMCQLYRHVFVKPVWGSLGSGILRLKSEGATLVLDVPGKGQHRYEDSASCLEALEPLLPRQGIVQQGLDLATAGGRLVDFRVVVQKNGTGVWTVTGIVGRCGTQGLFLSNMATGGFPLAAEDALSLLFGRHPQDLFERKQELATLAQKVAISLDRSGLLLGDLGFDIAYDRTGHPWVIEANNRDPDHNIAWECGSWPMFLDFRTTPVKFACHLAGF